MIDTVLLDQHRARGKTWFQINWHTGATSEHWRVRRVRGSPLTAALSPWGRGPAADRGWWT